MSYGIYLYSPLHPPAQPSREMHRLGHVQTISYDGSILVQAEFAPPRGAVVVDRRKRTVGRVARIFGPVKEPFATVRPEGTPSLALIGAEVFIQEGETDARKEDRRGRRSH